MRKTNTFLEYLCGKNLVNLLSFMPFLEITKDMFLLSSSSIRMPSFGISLKSSQVDLPKTKTFTGGSSGALLSNTSLDASLDGWDGIALEYSVDWPLQLFFTQEVLSK